LYATKYILEEYNFEEKEEVIVVNPTLRLNERFVDKPLGVQIGLFNKDSVSHNFVIMLSLCDDKDTYLGAVSNKGILSGENKNIYNYCFEESKNCTKYKLKVAINCDGENKYYNFQLKAQR
jgi:hypothetical protein